MPAELNDDELPAVCPKCQTNDCRSMWLEGELIVSTTCMERQIATLAESLRVANSTVARLERDNIQLARNLGVAQGQLAASESAAVVRGWQERAEMAESRLTAADALAKAVAPLFDGLIYMANVCPMENTRREEWQAAFREAKAALAAYKASK